MIAGILNPLSVPVALFIGTVGATSVVKAVYVDKRELKCASVGGDSPDLTSARLMGLACRRLPSRLRG